MTSASILTQSFLANGIYNFDSSRFRHAPLDTRKEGWTEAWGDSTLGSNDVTSSKSASEILDEDSISMLLATAHPQLPITLVQYRPAWLEQLVMRMSGIPHVVVNSTFACSEATGQLPYLRDLQPSKSPILVGRRDPSSYDKENSEASQNCILTYLIKTKGIDLDSHITSEKEKALSTFVISMLNVELRNLLVFLRYEDSDAWEQVYSQQCIHATCPKGNTWFTQVGGWFQAWSERVVSQQRLGDIRRMTVKEAVDRAHESYQGLERYLLEHSAPFFLGGSRPSLVDAYLCDHLAHALCDVNLVIALASFPRLVKYFENIHETYFGNSAADTSWKVWNQKQNICNAFQQLPIMQEDKTSSKPHFKDAIELMQGLSIHQHDLHEGLLVAKQKRQEESRQNTNTKNNLHRWRMGGNVTDPPKEDTNVNKHPMRLKQEREQKRNDELWISGAFCVTVLAFGFLQGA